jgi:hypothetical protein
MAGWSLRLARPRRPLRRLARNAPAPLIRLPRRAAPSARRRCCTHLPHRTREGTAT